jgi:hypothetical protein
MQEGWVKKTAKFAQERKFLRVHFTADFVAMGTLSRRGLADDQADDEEHESDRQTATDDADESVFADVGEEILIGFQNAGD